MAPSDVSCGNLTSKERTKLRKPAVEKLRRDRINRSIMQLKLLLEKEFQKHHPSSKLEKADILEMAVSYLRQQSQLQLETVDFLKKIPELDFTEGYSRCLQETLHYLSLHEPKKETGAKLLSHFHRGEGPAKDLCSPVCLLSSVPCQTLPMTTLQTPTTALWRPW
ncbi:transcription factor HES-5 [Latimeria chalumnae]|uniref:transcription factor HES-5 n=1 Tax=Latimeria chalumnae TaxID=7897 RepID=UPI0003C10205|nr:PREDICTED: transcription factor HES-5 [Latimeria chalumnae]|eukprot:XP_005996651.1 PREDICTED: transcription factor HES-5 [Latimeria chalumnae]